MISKLLIPELIFCIGAIFAYYAYYVVRYRKQPKVFILAAWGLGAYFLFNAFSNALVVMLIQVLGEQGAKTLALESPIILSTIKTVFETVSLIFIAVFIINQMRKRKVFVDEKSVDMTGYIMGAGTLFVPFMSNTLLMGFVQALVNVSVLISNPTGEGIKGVSVEEFNAIKEAYININNFYFVEKLLGGIIAALVIALVFKYLNDTFEKHSFKDKVWMGVFYFIVVGLSVVIKFAIPSTMIQIALRLIMLAGVLFLTLNYSKLVKEKQ